MYVRVKERANAGNEASGDLGEACKIKKKHTDVSQKKAGVCNMKIEFASD